VFTVEGTARVDIRNLTVDGAFRMPPTGRLHGIYYRGGADGTVENVEIVNVRSNPLSGAQGPAAAFVRGDGLGDPCEVTFRSCLVHEWGKGGIVGSYETVLTVEHSVVEGSGRVDLGLPAQNAIQVSYDCVGILRFNRISDSSYIPNTYGASGILLYNHGAGTVVEGNEVARCEGSIWVVSQPAASIPTQIRNNNVTASYGGGLWIQGVTGVQASGNVFQLPLATEIPVYDDDPTAGNAWVGNSYSDYSGAGAYPIDGGANVDPAPLAGCKPFGAITQVALGAVPVEVLALDLDGAPGTDFVAVTDSAVPTLEVGLDNGAGYTLTSLSFGNLGGRPVAVVAGDFDGLGGPDLAVLTVNVPPATTENKVYLFANTAGVFGLLHTESLPATVFVPNDLAVGDLDADPADDLVVADLGTVGQPGSLAVLRNGGSGTTWTSSALGGFATQCQSVAVGNLDGDSFADLAVAVGNGSTGAVHLLVGDGLGGFAPSAAGPFPVAANPNAIALADLDVDGRLDILVSSYGAALPLDAGVLTTLRNALPATMETVATPTDRGPVSIAAGDLFADDDPDTLRRDAVAANFAAGDVTVLGGFTAASGFGSALVCPLGLSPRSAVIADMDGDAYPDLVVADAGAQQVLLVHGRATARVDLYGLGCPGTADRIPLISTVGAPALGTQPNPTLGLEVRDARPLSVAVLNASFGAAASSGPCDLLLASIDVSWVQFTTAGGRARVSVPVPASPDLSGVSLFFQWVVIDPEGDLLDLAALSQALKLRIGG
jgi:hypothetical protein